MSTPPPPWGLPINFAGLDAEFSSFESSRVAVLPVPYDFSTSYQGGTRWGPNAILAASRNMEVWDDELGATYKAGIHTLAELEPTALGPGEMVRRVEQAFDWMFEAGKLPVMLGGEHSITAGAVRSALKRFPKLSVLQLDAHADMRDTYLDSPDSHACVMRRIRELCPAASVGIRSMSEEEAEHLKAHPAPMWSTRKFRELKGDWKPILDSLSGDVFITFETVRKLGFLLGLCPTLRSGTPLRAIYSQKCRRGNPEFAATRNSRQARRIARTISATPPAASRKLRIQSPMIEPGFVPLATNPATKSREQIPGSTSTMPSSASSNHRQRAAGREGRPAAQGRSCGRPGRAEFRSA